MDTTYLCRLVASYERVVVAFRVTEGEGTMMRAQAHSDGRPDHGTVRLLHAHAFSLSLSLAGEGGR